MEIPRFSPRMIKAMFGFEDNNIPKMSNSFISEEGLKTFEQRLHNHLEDIDYTNKNLELELKISELETEIERRMKMIRKFEKVSRVKDLDFELPKRSTKNSGGYDFFNPEDVQCFPDTITMVRTGIKAIFPEDEVLLMFNRSSNPKKKHLILINGVGVVDCDYYNNQDNEGEMAFPFYNTSKEIITIKAGEKLGQGLFVKFGITDDDTATGERTGGFGSTGK